MKKEILITLMFLVIILNGCATKDIQKGLRDYQCQDHCEMVYIDDWKQLQIQCHYNSTIYEVGNGHRCNQITQVFRMYPDTDRSDGSSDYPID